MPIQKILVVDDSKTELHHLSGLLGRRGYTVRTAENGDEAMRVATTTHVDVAVLDVMMTTPTEGFLLARAMRQDDRTKHIPLLMLTSVNAENEAQGSPFRFTDRDRDPQWLPVDRFVDKPVKPEDLVSMVRTLAGAWTFPR